jgi:hypothetical protein
MELGLKRILLSDSTLLEHGITDTDRHTRATAIALRRAWLDSPAMLAAQTSNF